ncbi:MAG: hypothetical protein ACLUD0_10590 [Eubacterium ramulus]
MEQYIADCHCEAGRRVLALTPEMLPVLKQAGVVDSGGQGLVEVLKGAQDAFLGKEVDYTFEAAPCDHPAVGKNYCSRQRQRLNSVTVRSLSLY